MANFDEYHSFLVVGLARSGVAVSALLASHGHAVSVYDDDPQAMTRFADTEVAREFRQRVTALSPQDAALAATRSDCVVVSPGVPMEHP
ncbi:MAG: hypothetical protein OEV86_03995, partial [Candidatus Krumholzibacteria bacterium]|nr:hypothetical protein [Candidatus Krumholzibacteria bacterium]